MRLFFMIIGGFPAFFNMLRCWNQFWTSVAFLKSQAYGGTSTADLCKQFMNIKKG